MTHARHTHARRFPAFTAASLVAALRPFALCTALAATIAIAGASAFAQDTGRKSAEGNSTAAQKSKSGAQSRREEAAKKAEQKAKAKWFDKLDREDKAALEPVVGFALPELPESDERLHADFTDFKSLRGKVVVIQTFTTRNAGGLAAAERARKAVEASGVGKDSVVLVAIHTPDGIDKAKALLEKHGLTMPIVLDAEGVLCDGLGAFRRPLAYAIDRQGNIRYAGLSDDGIEGAVKELAAEAFDAAVEPTARPETIEVDASVPFPQYSSPVGSAIDLRGKQAPAFAIGEWWNGAPNVAGKLAIVDFWATWCNPCRAAIPHMNDIAKAYPQDVACMGISDESKSNFDEGCVKHKLKKSDFAYAVGIDPQARMKNVFGVRGIPHVAVISADGIVRWQGHPSGLTPQVVGELVNANRALVQKALGARGGVSDRWSKTKR
ncbi:MAG: hypothetical protein RI967_1664 [Planctomycetota bacterium]